MLRRRPAVLATIAAGALVLAGCTASVPPSATTAETTTLPGWVTVPEEVTVVGTYAVGERDGVIFTALEADDGGWCLAMHRGEDEAFGTACSGELVVSMEVAPLASARLGADGIVDPAEGEAISEWVVVYD